MTLDSIRMLFVVGMIAWSAIGAGCRDDGDAVDSDLQGLRGGAARWNADGGDGRGPFGGRGRDDDDADGGSDERDCRDRWRRGIGDHDGHHHHDDGDDGDWNRSDGGFGSRGDDEDGWDGRR